MQVLHSSTTENGSLSHSSDSRPPPHPAAVPFAHTIRKVDRAVARLEELQCMVHTSHGNANVKHSPPAVRSKLALHTADCFPNKHTSNGGQECAQHASSNKRALRITRDNYEQGRKHAQHIRNGKSSGLPVARSRRSLRVADFPPPPSHKQVISSAADAQKDSLDPHRMKSSPSMPLSSSPSSACSSSVQVVTRRARRIKDMAPSELPKASSASVGRADPKAASLKPPKTFFVHAGQANPNRPWCLSSSPSPVTNTSTTSNYIDSPSSNSSVPLPTKCPSKFSPLHRQISSKCRESPQMQPLLCKSLECVNKPIEVSPNHPRKIPCFSRTRLSLPPPPSLGTKMSACRLSLTSNRHRESPPRPLPALITRLPTRQKTASFLDKKLAASPKRRTHTSKCSTPNASPQKVNTIIGRSPSRSDLPSPWKPSTSSPIAPLPLPPALQGLPSSTQHNPTSLLGRKIKASHKRSSSCPRQCLLPLVDGPANVNDCNLSSSPLPAKVTGRRCLQSTGKENCFSGCGPAAWSCLRRSWSFSQRHSLDTSNITGTGPSLSKHVKGYMQNGTHASSQLQVYKTDSFMQEPNGDQRKLYIG